MHTRTWCLWIAIAVLGGGPVWADCLPSGRATFVKGVDALSRGDLAAAKQAFDDLVKEQPDCAEARNNLAAVLVEQGQLDAAAEQLRRALEIRPDYQRAQVNLERVQTMLAARQKPNVAPKPTLEVEAAAHVQPNTPTAEGKPAQPTSAPAPVAPPVAATALPPPPAALAVLEPQGASASVVDLATRRLCVYRRAAEGIVADTCYPVMPSRTDGWAAWLVASDLDAQRIRLVDATGEKRAKVIPTSAPSTDTLQVAAGDFTALSKTIVPWRTGWLILPSAAAPDTTAKAAADAVGKTLQQWRQAWENKQFNEYTGFYAANFAPQDSSLAAWTKRKRDLFAQNGAISVQIDAPSVFVINQGNTVITSFEQKYHSKLTTSRCVKILRWQREAEHWRITAETVLWEES